MRSLRRICDFFGVDEFEILMPPDQFRDIVRLRPAGEAAPGLPRPAQMLIDHAGRMHSQLARYCGYYYKYFYSFSTPQYVLRSLVCVQQQEQMTFYKTIERLTQSRTSYASGDLFKYQGIVLPVGDRIHMIDRESIVGNELSQTILYPTSRNRVSSLIGLMIGITATEAHQPVAARVVMEFLGRRINHREAIRGCGLFREEAAEISPAVLSYLRDASPTEAFLMRAGANYEKATG
jgi:hypothetical protein